MEIKVGEQKCNDRASFDEEVISGMDILMDIRKICKALDDKKLRISPDSEEYKSNGLGTNGSKHHFTISWIEGCTFPSKERTRYGMRAFDPRETGEEIDGMNRCEYMLNWNWKECEYSSSISSFTYKISHQEWYCMLIFTIQAIKPTVAKEVIEI